MNGQGCLLLSEESGRCLRFSSPVDYLQFLLENGFHHAESTSLKPVCPHLEVPSPVKVEDLCKEDETSFFVNERVESARSRSSQMRLQITGQNEDLTGHLLYACAHGLPTALQLVLNSPHDIDLNAPLPCANKQELPPLVVAAMSPSAPCCEVLIKAGANLEWSDNNKGRTALHWAVLAGRLPSVKVLLKHGASPSTTDKEGFTPLLYATLTGGRDIVSTILKEVPGLVDQCHEPTGLSPLMCACMRGDLETVKLLLKHGADLTLCDTHHQSSLHHATWGGNLKTVKLIMSHSASVLVLRDGWGRTAFTVAAAKGDMTILQYLLKKGSKWTETDNEGRTPLHWAILSKQNLCVEKMLEHHSSSGSLVNQPDNNGATPVHYAAMTGSEDILNVLMAKNGSSSVRDHSGYSPLVWAAVGGKIATVKLLLQCTSDESPETLQPLHAAACVGALEVCQILLEAGAMVDVVGPNGMTPLHYSCRHGHSKCVQLLLSAGANVDSLNNLQESGVHLASLYGHASVVSSLSEHGTLKDKHWLLHLASSKGHTEVLRILLDHGCWVDYPCDSDGRTSLHLSASQGHLACCQLVVERGANINTRDSSHERFTALDLAMLNTHSECVEYLMAQGATSGGGKFHRAALSIQSVWKFHRHKRRSAIARQWASVVIQRVVRCWLCRRKAGRVRQTRERARNRTAAIIQYHWRLYITRRRRYEATYTKLKARLQQEHLATSIILSELNCQTQSVRLPTPAKTKSLTSPNPSSLDSRYLLKASSVPPIPLFPSGSLLFPSKPRKPLIKTTPVISIASNRSVQPPTDRPLSTIPEEELSPPPLPPAQSLADTPMARVPPSDKPLVATQGSPMPRVSPSHKPLVATQSSPMPRISPSHKPLVATQSSPMARVSLSHKPLVATQSSPMPRISPSDKPLVAIQSSPVITALNAPSKLHQNRVPVDTYVQKNVDKLPSIAHNGSIVSAPKALQPTEAGTVKKVKHVELPPLHTNSVEEKSTVGTKPHKQHHTTRQSVFKDVPPRQRPVTQRQRDQGDVDQERVLKHAQRYDRLSEVLSLLQQARDSPSGQHMGDLKQQIQTALNEAIRLRADTEAPQSAAEGLQAVL